MTVMAGNGFNVCNVKCEKSSIHTLKIIDKDKIKIMFYALWGGVMILGIFLFKFLFWETYPPQRGVRVNVMRHAAKSSSDEGDSTEWKDPETGDLEMVSMTLDSTRSTSNEWKDKTLISETEALKEPEIIISRAHSIPFSFSPSNKRTASYSIHTQNIPPSLENNSENI